MSSRLACGEQSLSRRSLMFVLVGAAAATSLVLVPTAALGQAGAWREYRHDDFGFRVEFPVEFKTEAEVADPGDVWIRSAGASIDIDGMTLGVHCTEYRDAMPVEEQYRLQREGMRVGTMPVTREEPRMVSGIPAHEFIREADDLNYISRMVVVEKRTIAVSAFGERSIHGHATVRRFLDSLTLLQGAR